ncbi:MAG: hypothetical protein ACFUZC_22770 [Chthoniobacteraceae bacterium]
MKINFLWLLLLFCAPEVIADPNEDESAFLEIPGATAVRSSHVDDVFTEIPKELRKELDSTDIAETGLEIRGFTFDLNKDGQTEYFIYDYSGSGSGGPAYMIYSQLNHHWQNIGGFQGGLYLYSVSKGWPQLVSIGRGGGGCWTKCYMRFKSGSYQPIIYERYDRGKITWDRASVK